MNPVIIFNNYLNAMTNEQVGKIVDIFCKSSNKKKFIDDKERKSFEYQWLKIYWEYSKSFSYWAETNEIVSGYLVAWKDSSTFPREFGHHSFYLFESNFFEYPSHLHVNCHPAFIGQSIGSALVNRACRDLIMAGSKGVHIVTSPGSLNVKFYEKLGFTFRKTIFDKDIEYLFMGKTFPTSL